MHYPVLYYIIVYSTLLFHAVPLFLDPGTALQAPKSLRLGQNQIPCRSSEFHSLRTLRFVGVIMVSVLLTPAPCKGLAFLRFGKFRRVPHLRGTCKEEQAAVCRHAQVWTSMPAVFRMKGCFARNGLQACQFSRFLRLPCQCLLQHAVPPRSHAMGQQHLANDATGVTRGTQIVGSWA